MYVKVRVEGEAFVRKVDLGMVKGYGELVDAVEKLFGTPPLLLHFLPSPSSCSSAGTSTPAATPPPASALRRHSCLPLPPPRKPFSSHCFCSPESVLDGAR